jgi:hypothetical protein
MLGLGNACLRFGVHRDGLVPNSYFSVLQSQRVKSNGSGKIQQDSHPDRSSAAPSDTPHTDCHRVTQLHHWMRALTTPIAIIHHPRRKRFSTTQMAYNEHLYFPRQLSAHAISLILNTFVL